MKKLAILLTITLLLGLFTGCNSLAQQKETEEPETFVECPAKLGSKAAKTIEEALLAKRGGTVNWWTKDKLNGNTRYYGSDNGYDIICDLGGEGIAVVTCIDIDGEIFKHGNAFGLYAYKDGELFGLKAAYESGLVSKEAVIAAAKLHQESQAMSYPNLGDDYWTNTED